MTEPVLPQGAEGPSDDSLAVQAGKGDARAFGTLYDRYAPRVARLLRTFARDDHELADLVHDTFCRLMVALPSYRPKGTFRSWLFTIALNVGRHASCRARTIVRATPDEPEGLSHGLYPAESRALARRLLSLLPEEKRVVVVMRIWLGLPYEEIGAILSIPPATARTRMHGAIHELRALLEDDEAEEVRAR